MKTSCWFYLSRKVTLQADTIIAHFQRYPLLQQPSTGQTANPALADTTKTPETRLLLRTNPSLRQLEAPADILGQFSSFRIFSSVHMLNGRVFGCDVFFRECSKLLKFEFNQALLKLMSNQQVSAPIGIDLGSWTSKIAVAKRGGVEIITNEANFRETPCVVGYGPAERNIGEAGNIKMKSNFKDTVSFPARFLGLRPDYPMLRAEKKFCPAKCVTKDDRVAFEVKYQGQAETVFPEQVFAAYLNKLKFILQKNNFENKSGVLAVPAYLTQQERKALLDAAKIAEFSVTRLINESTAVALDYGMFRKNDLDATTPRNVLFIDFGHSKLSAFACSFTSSEMNVLEQEHCRHIGCRDIDYHLFEFYRAVFEKSSGGSDISENKKAIVKLFEQIERQRKILSGNIEHDLNIEYLMDECDLQYTMTRDKLEELCQPIFKAIVEVLTKLRDSLKARNLQLHSIELVGGGSRIPSFVNLVKSVFGIDPSRTLNSSESVARGCALMAAIKSPLFRVSDYALNERVYYGVKFSWNFVEGEKLLGLNSELYPEKQRKFIYEAGAKVPSSKTIKFTRKEAIEILIEYQPAVNGFSKHIGYFVTKPQNPQHETFGVAFKIKFTEDGLVTFEECSLVEEWFEETRVPKKKEEKKKEERKEGEPEKMEEEEFEVKKTKKEKYTAIKYDANTFDNFTQKDIDSFFAAESTMVNQDRMILETYERKNELESLTYNWKEKLATTHQPYAKPEEVPAIIAFLDNEREWLYNDGQNANRGTYNEHIAAVKTKVSHIAKRHDSKEHLEHQLKLLADAFNTNYASLNSLDKKHEHITPEERQEGFSLIEKLKNWAGDAVEQQKKKPSWEDLVITPQQVKDQIRELNDKVKKIMGRPAPPPPPKPEEKKEQPAPNPTGPAAAEEKKMEEQLPKGEKMDVQ